jgi:hypothetical protein
MSILSQTTENEEYSDEIVDQEIMQFGSPDLTFETTAFSLQFKKLQLGNNYLDLQKTLLLSDVLNALANAASRGVARDLASLHQNLFGRTAMAEGTCGSVDEMFDDDYSLKEEFVGENTDGWVNSRQREYVTMRAGLDLIDDLIKTWNAAFVNAPNRLQSGPQFAVVRNTDPRTQTRTQWVPILDPMEAIQHYYSQSSVYLNAVRLHEQAQEREKHMQAAGSASRGRSAMAF